MAVKSQFFGRSSNNLKQNFDWSSPFPSFSRLFLFHSLLYLGGSGSLAPQWLICIDEVAWPPSTYIHSRLFASFYPHLLQYLSILYRSHNLMKVNPTFTSHVSLSCFPFIFMVTITCSLCLLGYTYIYQPIPDPACNPCIFRLIFLSLSFSTKEYKLIFQYL